MSNLVWAIIYNALMAWDISTAAEHWRKGRTGWFGVLVALSCFAAVMMTLNLVEFWGGR